MTAARITILTSHKAPLCKRFSLQGDYIIKQASAALYSSRTDVVTASTATELSQILDRIDHRQAIATGILKAGTKAPISTASKAGQGTATRSLSDFKFPKAPGRTSRHLDGPTSFSPANTGGPKGEQTALA